MNLLCKLLFVVVYAFLWSDSCAADKEKLITRTYKVTEGEYDELIKLSKQRFGADLRESFGIIVFQRFGIEFPKGTGAVYVLGMDKLIVIHTRDTLTRIEKYIGEAKAAVRKSKR